MDDALTASATVPGFLPSTSAFRFTNSFPKQPVLRIPVPGLGAVPIGDASRGLCGGMIYTIRDLFEAGIAPPDSTSPPALGSPMYRYLVRRLFDSFDIPRGVYRYYRMMSGPDADVVRGVLVQRGVSRTSVVDEWPRIRIDLDCGQLAPLGVITLRSADPLRLGINHQVLAYGYEQRGGVVTLRVYDPNTPSERADAVTLTFDVRRQAQSDVPVPIRHTIAVSGRPVRGFFHTRYRWTDPRSALP